jgi:uncharacterized protein (TIGR00369 family)
VLRLEDDKWCFVCGTENPSGFRLRFEHPEPGVLRAKTTFKKDHQGYKGVVHGGLVSALLDEMMVNLAWVEGRPSVTAEITVRLLKPTAVGQTVHLEGRLLTPEKRVIRASAEARSEAGELLASATATLVRIQVGS